MKGKKLLLSMIMLIIAIVLMFKTESFAETKTLAVGQAGTKTAYLREGERVFYNPSASTFLDTSATRYAYVTTSLSGIYNNTTVSATRFPVYKIVEMNGSTPNYDSAIYCLKAGLGFGDTAYQNNTYSNVQYTLRGNFATSEILNYYNSTFTRQQLTNQAKYKSLLWLLDNLYLPKQIQEDAASQTAVPELGYKAQQRHYYLKKILSNSTQTLTYNGQTLSPISEANVLQYLLTDDDIEVVQQWAIWYYTNNGVSGDTIFNNFPNVLVSSDGKVANITNQSASDYDLNGHGEDMSQYYQNMYDDGQERITEMKTLFKYLIANAEANNNYTKVSLSLNTDSVTSEPENTLNQRYKIGPFKVIKQGNSTSYGANITITDLNDTQLAPSKYSLYNANGLSRDIETLIRNGEDIYIYVDKTALTTKGIKVRISYNGGRNVTLWDAGSSNQPVVILKDDNAELEATVTLEEFDLALRKYVTDITRDGVSIKNSLSQMTTRTPNIITTELAAGTSTTAKYNHRKDAIPVETGDIVTYNITIYNEGELAGRATEITDLLPDGLEFYQAVSTDYDFSVSGQTITITPKASNTANLAAYTSGTPASKTITFLCRVTKVASNGRSEVLTNIAQITKAIDSKGVVYTSSKKERDSTPGNLPERIDLPSYKGNSSNKSDLSDSTYFYKGQEDDDDFEKLIVTTPQFDLALRKYIVGLERPTIKNDGTTEIITITPTDVTELNGRTPSIDVSPLKNNRTTATYTHVKTPVPVKTGDIVTYKITIYNEGEISGRATKITDYLPAGLEFYSIDATSKYTAEEKIENGFKKIIFTAKTGLDNLDAFDKNAGTALDSETIEFKCKVIGTTNPGTSTDLKNVAEITEAKDSNNNLKIQEGDDRDSTPNNIEEYIETYGTQSKEDDDDFEVLKLSTPKFDLSLRKFITAITNEDGTERSIESRVPDVNTAPLTNTTKVDTTALYKHTKDVLVVKPGDIITFTIRVYNEGQADGFVTEIEDFFEDGLALASTSLNTQYGWSTPITNELGKQSTKTTYLNGHVLRHFEKGRDLDYADIKIDCVVTESAVPGHKLTNIAQINGYVNLENTGDIDSQVNNFEMPNEGLEAYDGTGILTDADFEEEQEPEQPVISNNQKYYKGQQDDDDFEKIEIYTPGFDLALKKYITKVEDEDITDREPEVNTASLTTGYNATYVVKKDPVKVNIGDTVRYAIRVYNEGEVDGYATEIEDYLPQELEYIDNEFNRERGWHVVTDKSYGNDRTGTIVATDALRDELIRAYNGGDTLDSKYVEIECRVKEIGTINGKVLTNIAQITAAEDRNRNPIENPGDDRDSEPNNAQIPNDSTLPGYSINQQDDDDYEKIYVPAFDLALVKFITQVKHEDGTSTSIDRNLTVDVTPLKNGELTADYDLIKTPVTVNVGDTVVYTIRVYNEGETDGYVSIIEDYIPSNLEIVSKQDSEINAKYDWDIKSNGRIATTQYWSKDEAENRTVDTDYILEAFDTKTSTDLDFVDVQIECRIKDSAQPGEILTNIAQINGDSGDDRDSAPTNAPKPEGDELAEYPEGYELQREDDDDYEKVRLYQPQYDLALRKFITKIGDKDITDRVPVVDVTPLKDNSSTTAVYTHSKTPLLVKNGDIVEYTIRVYNEGVIDGYAEEIKDNIPEGLEYIIDNETNIEYRWKLSPDQKTVTSDYLSSDRDENNVIRAFNSNAMNTLNYKDVKIAFRVVEPNTSTRIIRNIAEIKAQDGTDIDSIPDNDKPGEDDIDEENIRLTYFDLALQKFISKVEDKNGENLPIETEDTKDVSREPSIEIDSDGKIKYVHTKDPVIVANSDVVIYTIRVYNEGTIAGYAEEVKDNVPVGLQLVQNHAINVKYGWVMYDEDGKVTDDPAEAKTIRTTYLSEAKSEDNIIEAFDRTTMTEPAYKDVQVAFKVSEKNVGEERIIRNIAEISKDSDDDIDSTPDNDEPDEDDIDDEFIKLKYFDLSLLKWVSKVMLTENGKTTVKETGYNGTENPEPIVKTELTPKQVKSATLKYEFGIKITNEGQIPGYAKEVADYIPEGLEFIPADNPLWTLKEDGKIVTKQLEDTLIQPGDSAVITVVFKWKNGDNNYGEKVNWAEISKDYNDKDAEDIDSIPDNNQRNPKEDDIDNARVILNPKTGETAMYITLTFVVLTIISTGVILIKKYVL